MGLIQDKFSSEENMEKQWKSIYTLGGIVTIIALTGVLLDIFIGSVTGGNLSALPQTSIDRFSQFHASKFLGLYNHSFTIAIATDIGMLLLGIVIYIFYRIKLVKQK